MKPNEDAEFEALRKLRTEPAGYSTVRLRRRLRLAQLGRDMFTQNAGAFWTVLNAFMKILFRGKGKPKPHPGLRSGPPADRNGSLTQRMEE